MMNTDQAYVVITESLQVSCKAGFSFFFKLQNKKKSLIIIVLDATRGKYNNT